MFPHSLRRSWAGCLAALPLPHYRWFRVHGRSSAGLSAVGDRLMVVPRQLIGSGVCSPASTICPPSRVMQQRSFGFSASISLRVFAMRSPFRVEYFSDLDRNEDSSRTFPRVWCRAFVMGSPVLGRVAYLCALDWNDGLFHPSILHCFAMGSPYGSSVVFPPTQSERSRLWIAGRYSFRMGSPFSGQVLSI